MALIQDIYGTPGNECALLESFGRYMHFRAALITELLPRHFFFFFFFYYGEPNNGFTALEDIFFSVNCPLKLCGEKCNGLEFCACMELSLDILYLLAAQVI